MRYIVQHQINGPAVVWDNHMMRVVGDGKGGKVTSKDFDVHNVAKELNIRVGV